MDRAEILEAAAGMKPWLVEVRRLLHMTPELGRREKATSDLISLRLDELGIAHRRGGTSIVGLVEGTSGGPTVALRADIDALPISEANDVGYRSRNAGVMHACGHDAHAAILLGVARYFSERRENLRGNIKLLFQPDEEGDGGAEIMIAGGCLENPRVDRVIGLHVMPYIPTGTIEVRKGALNGSSATLKITIRGKGAHGAYPELGIDAVLIAANVVMTLNTLVARCVSPLEQAVITIGTISGGQRSNIIADEVRMTATMRTTSDAVRDALVARARAVVEGVAASFGGSGELELSYGYTALINHDRTVDTIVEVAGELLGKDAVRWKDKPSMGVEDFSFFIRERPGAFYHLGCGNEAKGITAPLHNSRFDIDEDCLVTGVAMQAGIASRLLETTKAGGTE
ncbi:MAG: M20 family metallopeptidase [Spirochaetes bacterium]|nr:M20 family metallopeptidase [Spirochaetota bacterium]